MKHTVIAEAVGTQWGCGHGGFHTQGIPFTSGDSPASSINVNFIYDCGTVSSTAIIDAQIERICLLFEKGKYHCHRLFSALSSRL